TAISEQVGPLLRQWRERRRLSQLELALEAGVSARHLSFVETGRSKPGRDMLLRLVGQLDVPLREQNRLLLAAGHAPAFPERPLGGPELAPVGEALDLILRGHEPYPAVVVDRAWNLVAANSSTVALASVADVDPDLLGPVRVRLPDGAELSFFGMFATFDTPFDVTSSELAVELLFPADRATATALRERARQGR